MTDTEHRQPPGSPRAIAKMKRRDRLFEEADGQCFYCGCFVTEYGWGSMRDWLLLRDFPGMVVEHKTPLIRGGSDLLENVACACQDCNKRKGAFTVGEFRSLTALRRGDLNFRFFGEPTPAVKRDWLICHSADQERELHIHNVPSAAIAYGLRNGRARLGSEFKRR